MALRKELGLSHAVLVFENLNELLQTMDEYADLHSKTVARYDDRLGQLLRGQGVQRDQTAMSSSLDAVDPEDSKKDKKQKGDKKREGEERGWTTLGTEEFSIKISNGNASITSNEVSVLFKIVESLKAKIAMINTARKMLSELPTQGFRGDQRLRVVFRDGIPKQIIPTNEMADQQRKFRYVEQFQIMPLK